MPSVVLRPNGTISDAGATTGAASLHAALGDNSDASYTTSIGLTGSRVDLDTVALPVGAMARQARMRARVASSDAGTTMSYIDLYVDGAPLVEATPLPRTVTGVAWVDLASAFFPVSWLQATIDGIYAVVYCGAPTANSLGRVAELYVDLVYALVPTVTVSAPTGTLTTTTLPTVVWLHTPGADGGPQSNYQIRVFTAAQYGVAGFHPATSLATLDTGAVVGTASSVAVGPLANSTTYRAYVRTAQSVNGVAQWADYAYSAFSLAATTSKILTVAFTADNVNGRNRIVVTRDTATPTWATIDLQRSVDSGNTWVTVRGVTGSALYGDTWIGYDYEAGNSQQVIYRARATYQVIGLSITGDWVQSAAVTSWAMPGVDWLKDLRRPTLSMQVTVEQLSALVRTRPSGSFSVVGRADPVIVSDVQHLATGVLTVATLTDDEATALERLLEADVLLFQVRPGDRFGSRYLAFGEVTEARVADLVTEPSRHWVLPFVEVAAPADFVVSVPGLTWADVVATYATWTAFVATVPTWGDLI